MEIMNLSALYIDNRLADMLDLMDEVHTAASEGGLEKMTTLNRNDLVEMLQELIYTAQETIEEINCQDQPQPKTKMVLRLLEKSLANKLQA